MPLRHTELCDLQSPRVNGRIVSVYLHVVAATIMQTMLPLRFNHSTSAVVVVHSLE
jgi:hypothetical protein